MWPVWPKTIFSPNQIFNTNENDMYMCMAQEKYLLKKDTWAKAGDYLLSVINIMLVLVTEAKFLFP